MARVGLITVSDSRSDFFQTRKHLVEEELMALNWLRSEFELLESEVITSESEVALFANEINSKQVDCLIINIPIWADPILSVKVSNYIKQPILLLGNNRADTSSLVGILGAGGALDQVGRKHTRVFRHDTESGKNLVRAFIRAASAISRLRGNTLGCFGTRSLGIFTTVSDVAQWQKIFDVDIKFFDENMIVEKAESVDPDMVADYKARLLDSLGSCEYGGLFTPEVLDKQVRGYLGFKEIISENDLDFVCNKCQRALSDGYTAQCLSHMMLNSTRDLTVSKEAIVHACESDTDGALTMRILNLISGGKAAALMDVRYLDLEQGLLFLANCGALASDFFCEDNESSCGLSEIKAVPHVFGAGGGCAFPGIVREGPITLARLCRNDGRYWMAIIKAESVIAANSIFDSVTPQFPKVMLRVNLDQGFLDKYGANHIHIIRGDYIRELEMFCKLKDIDCHIWE